MATLLTLCAALLQTWLPLRAIAQSGAGRVDATFDPAGLALPGRVQIVVRQADGKLLLAGDFPRRLLRLHPDGTTDLGFNANVGGAINALVVQTTGKIILGGDFGLLRLHANGSLDRAFKASVGGPVTTMVVRADDGIILGGDFTAVNGAAAGRLARLDAEGNLDTGFRASVDYFPVNLVVPQPDGKLLVLAQASLINGVAVPGIARLNADGTLDASFMPKVNGYGVIFAAVLADGKIVLGSRQGVTRLNADGTRDNFFPSGGIDGFVTAGAVQADGGVLVASAILTRFNPDGTEDWSFRRNFAGATVSALTVGPDGSIVLGGNFSRFDGEERLAVARLNADSTLDLTFAPAVASAPDARVEALVAQPDGKVILVGGFSRIGGITRGGVARLNQDGTLDLGFDAHTSNRSVVTAAVQADGKVLLGGNFGQVGGVTRNGLARVNADGSLDANFNARLDNEVSAVAVQADGKIVVAGNFYRVGTVVHRGMARLNAEGSLDQTFVNMTVNGYTIEKMLVQADGKILIGGRFTQIGSVTRQLLARLNADGSLDTGFDARIDSGTELTALATQVDGKILIGGDFTQVNGIKRLYLARLNPDGTLDESLDAHLGDRTTALALQADGKILLGSYVAAANGAPPRHFLRLNPDGSRDDGFNVDVGQTVQATLALPDGRIVLGGAFDQVNGISRYYVARLLGDAAGPPAPSVSVVGAGQVRGGFVVGRSVESADLALTVRYHNGGSAVRDVDYTAFDGTLSFAAGQIETVIPVTLLPAANRNRKVKVFLDPSPNGAYIIGKAQSKVFLSDLP